MQHPGQIIIELSGDMDQGMVQVCEAHHSSHAQPMGNVLHFVLVQCKLGLLLDH